MAFNLQDSPSSVPRSKLNINGCQSVEMIFPATMSRERRNTGRETRTGMARNRIGSSTFAILSQFPVIIVLVLYSSTPVSTSTTIIIPRETWEHSSWTDSYSACVVLRVEWSGNGVDGGGFRGMDGGRFKRFSCWWGCSQFLLWVGRDILLHSYIYGTVFPCSIPSRCAARPPLVWGGSVGACLSMRPIKFVSSDEISCSAKLFPDTELDRVKERVSAAVTMSDIPSPVHYHVPSVLCMII